MQIYKGPENHWFWYLKGILEPIPQGYRGTNCTILLSLAKWYSTVQIHHISDHSSINGYADFFHPLVIANRSAVNICAQDLLWTPVFISFGVRPKSGIPGFYGNSVLSFEEILDHTALVVVWGLQFLHILSNTCYYLTFFFWRYWGLNLWPHSC
jgi:hypothetical protein